MEPAWLRGRSREVALRERLLARVEPATVERARVTARGEDDAATTYDGPA